MRKENERGKGDSEAREKELGEQVKRMKQSIQVQVGKMGEDKQKMVGVLREKDELIWDLKAKIEE